MFIERENSCPCAYCKYYKPYKNEEKFLPFRNGICQKHNILRNVNDNLCEDFILMSGVHTNKWFPNNNTPED